MDIDDDALALYLKQFSLKGLLPKIPDILVTTYKSNQSIDIWLISYLWGIVFIYAQEHQMFELKYIHLFSINNYNTNMWACVSETKSKKLLEKIIFFSQVKLCQRNNLA